MKSGLVKRLLGESEDTEREQFPSLTAPSTGMSRYPRDEAATEKAQQMIGDGQVPDHFFITIGERFVDDEVQDDARETYCVFQTGSAADAEVKFNEIVLDGQEGPRFVQIENRLKGLVKMRYLTRVVSYSEQTRD
jgi:hypothetical protein